MEQYLQLSTPIVMSCQSFFLSMSGGSDSRKVIHSYKVGQNVTLKISALSLLPTDFYIFGTYRPTLTLCTFRVVQALSAI